MAFAWAEIPEAADFNEVAAKGDTYVASAKSGGCYRKVGTGPWEKVAAPAGVWYMVRALPGLGLFVMVSDTYNSDALIAISTDGASWVTMFGAGSSSPRNIVEANGKVLSVDLAGVYAGTYAGGVISWGGSTVAPAYTRSANGGSVSAMYGASYGGAWVDDTPPSPEILGFFPQYDGAYQFGKTWFGSSSGIISATPGGSFTSAGAPDGGYAYDAWAGGAGLLCATDAGILWSRSDGDWENLGWTPAGAWEWYNGATTGDTAIILAAAGGYIWQDSAPPVQSPFWTGFVNCEFS